MPDDPEVGIPEDPLDAPGGYHAPTAALRHRPDPVVAEGESTPAEGWYVDPGDGHAERWWSDGRPTSLVRDEVDGGELVEGHDEPVGAEGLTAPQPLPEPALDGTDLDRADAETAPVIAPGGALMPPPE